MPVTRRTFLASSAAAAAPAELSIENSSLRLRFDPASGALREAGNRLAAETYRVEGDEFSVETVQDQFRFRDFKLENLTRSPRELRLAYRAEGLTVDVVWTLGASHRFAEKRVWLTLERAGGLRRVVLSAMEFLAPGLNVVCYPHPGFARILAQLKGRVRRAAGTEPVRTYFCRTPGGGAFTGVEMPFDSSSLDARKVVLSCRPNIKVAAGERFACEPIYLGVYRRGSYDGQSFEMRPSDEPLTSAVLPLPSESQAMVAMTTAILGPRRHPGLLAMACGWHCEMEHEEYASDEAVEADIKSLDFIKELGLDWVSDSHPWSGETSKMNGLAAGQRYELGERVRRFLEYARKAGVKVVQWPTMNNTHPWSRQGQPFRTDRPEWLRAPVQRPGKDFRNTRSNCIGNQPFAEWVKRINFDALDTGLYDGWCMDGDFYGTGAYPNTTIKAECLSDSHDHLPEDSNYACQRALDRWIAGVRERYPKQLIVMLRPPMDLGVWSQRNVDACFTLIETGSGTSNIAGGDEIRTAARVRLHHHFFPHYLDWPLLFPSFSGLPGKRKKEPVWPSGEIDYILLSALSCSPNLLFYLPTKTGMPEADKAAIRRWLEWGRNNIAYLNVRQDLPDWPGAGKVDGSIHMIGDRGIVFLFNPNASAVKGRFRLNPASHQARSFRVRQEYPAGKITRHCRTGQTVEWETPARSALVLRLERDAK